MTIPLRGIGTPDAGVIAHGTRVRAAPALSHRNRLTCAFRPILAIPHLLLVGGPLAFGVALGWRAEDGPTIDSSAGPGVLGLVAGVVSMIAWFAILFTGRHPDGLRSLAALYVRWRVRAMAYMTLLRDEYPPFGDGEYPVTVEITAPPAHRDRVTVAFRLFLALPHIIVLWFLSVLWVITTVVSWFTIVFTGRVPEPLNRYGRSVLQWNARVDAYLLLLHDEYPPFTLE